MSRRPHDAIVECILEPSPFVGEPPEECFRAYCLDEGVTCDAYSWPGSDGEAAAIERAVLYLGYIEIHTSGSPHCCPHPHRLVQ